MKGQALRRMQLMLGCLGAAGCGASLSSHPPSVTITSPAELATVQPGTDPRMSLPVEFTVQNFTLKPSCGGKSNCGHVVLNIDIDGCKRVGEKYNDTGTASPIAAYFDTCQIGSHSLQLALNHDDETPELDASNNPVASQVITIFLATPDGG
jgi:hypothetical protein